MKLQKVTHEQARILKELGFPLQYAEVSFFTNETNSLYDEESGEIYELPSLELVAKWFRDEKKIFVNVFPFSKWSVAVFRYINNVWNSYGYVAKNEQDKAKNPKCYDCWETFEEALSAGIDKAIEKLKNE